jgi:excinuclease ABC subunit A
MEKPDVDRIDGICPAIAIRQKNSVRNPGRRSARHRDPRLHAAALRARGRTFCRQCGQEVVRETAEVVAGGCWRCPRARACCSASRCRCDDSRRPMRRADARGGPDEGRSWTGPRRPDDGDAGAAGGARDPRSRRSTRCGARASAACSSTAAPWPSTRWTPPALADRPDARGGRRPHEDRGRRAHPAHRLDRDRLPEGGGAAFALELPRIRASRRHVFSERFECRPCGIQYETPQPRLFSFNNPFGACPTCHGFGNIIELDMDWSCPIPRSRSPGRDRAVDQAALPLALAELKRAAKARGIRLDVPWQDLTDEERRFVVEGDGARTTRASAASSAGSSGRSTRCTSACSSAGTAAT